MFPYFKPVKALVKCQRLKVKRENQQDATNSMFIIKHTHTATHIYSWHTHTHVTKNIHTGTTNHIYHKDTTTFASCFPLLTGRTPHAVGHGLILLMMGIMMPETCFDRSLIINIELVASCWFSVFALCSRCTVTRTPNLLEAYCRCIWTNKWFILQDTYACLEHHKLQFLMCEHPNFG